MSPQLKTYAAAFGFAAAATLPDLRDARWFQAPRTSGTRPVAPCRRAGQARRRRSPSRVFASAEEPREEPAASDDSPASPSRGARFPRRRLLSVAPAAAAIGSGCSAGAGCACHGGALRGFLARAFADTYDAGMVEYESAMGDLRRQLLSTARGRVLEIGIGTGASLRYYPFGPGGVGSVVGVEPSEFMVPHCLEAARGLGVEDRVEVVPGRAESLPFADESFDTAVSTLVLCSVSDQALALAELRRVLRPGGRLLLLEHVLAPARRPLLRAAQTLLDPLQALLADGCHLNRRTEDALRAAGFAGVQAELLEAPVFPLISPHLLASARK
eukprot:tig00021178_g19204.t1